MALVWSDGCDEASDVAPGFLDGARLSAAHPVLDLGERLFDRIEVGGVWRQIPEPGACVPDEAAQGGGFVAGEIVHDDDVAGSQHGDELLFDIGPEALAIDGAVEDAGGGEPVTAQ